MMAIETVNIHEAKTHLSRLVEQAARGKPFIIARAGKPLVKVVPLDDPESVAERRFGFMAGRIKVPADFDDIARDAIEKMFSGDE
jgi:prevent-host-death family protein